MDVNHNKALNTRKSRISFPVHKHTFCTLISPTWGIKTPEKTRQKKELIREDMNRSMVQGESKRQRRTRGKKYSPTSRTKWDHNTSEPFLLREQCVYLEANKITSAEWAAVSQSQPLSLTSVAQLDPNREFDQPRNTLPPRQKPFLLEIKTLSNQTLKSVFQFRLWYRLLL